MTYGYRFVQGTVRTMNVVVSAQWYRMKNQATHAMPRPEVTLEIAIATCAFSLTVNIPPV